MRLATQNAAKAVDFRCQPEALCSQEAHTILLQAPGRKEAAPAPAKLHYVRGPIAVLELCAERTDQSRAP